jgi:hypothetical protein
MRRRSSICGIGPGSRRLEGANRLSTRSYNHSSSISFDYYILILILSTLSYGAGSNVWDFNINAQGPYIRFSNPSLTVTPIRLRTRWPRFICSS